MHRILRDDFKRISNSLIDKDSLKGTRWLITGPTGMIGSYFLSFLSWLNEAELDGSLSITALHRRELDSLDPNVGWLLGKKYLEFRRVDLSGNFNLQADDQFDYVFHGASNAAPRAYLSDPIGTINANVKATQVFLDHLKTSARLKGFIFLSSGEIYGNPDLKDVPTPEEYPGITNHLTPRSCYVEAKRFAETLCWNYFQAYGMPVKIIRPVHVYGPGFREGDGRVWADFIVKAARRETIEILSDGKARRGFCYLADAISQIMAVIQKGEAGSVYNVGNDEHLSIRELADLIAGLSAPPVQVIVKNEVPAYLQGSPQISCPSITKVSLLASLLKTPIEHGMKQSIEWFGSLTRDRGFEMNSGSYSLIDACRSCRDKDLVHLYAVDTTPVAGIYYDSGAIPVNVKAPMTLAHCRSCGLVQLKETISPDIYRDYSFVGDSAAVYQEHLADVATFLVEEWKQSGKTIFEIGASNGILLKYLAEKGGNRVSGVEPSQKLCEYAAGIGVHVAQGYFNETFVAQEKIGPFDCVIIRHVLEHIDDLNGMVHTVKSVIAPDGLLLVEVPDVEKIVSDNLFSNIFHEHLNYFSAHSLNGLMARHGFHAVYQKNVEIHGGSLLLLYKMVTDPSGAAASNLHHLGAFAETARSYYEAIHNKVVTLNRQGKVVHGYGASHRTFILLGNACLTEADIPVIYDSNSMLHGKRLNGFHMQVQPKESITVNKPDALVIFATSYEKEITDFLKNECRFEGDIISLRYEALCEK